MVENQYYLLSYICAQKIPLMSKWTIVVSSEGKVVKKVLDTNSCLDYLENSIDQDVKIISIVEDEEDNEDDLVDNVDDERNFHDGSESGIAIENGSETEFVIVLSDEEDLCNSTLTGEQPYISHTASNNSNASRTKRFTNVELSTTIEIVRDYNVENEHKDVANVDLNPPKPLGKYQCFVCPFNSTKKIYLSKHLVRHFDNRRPFTCPVCQKSFPRMDGLNKHIHCCADIRSYQCEQCDKAFTTSSKLVLHRRKTHSGMSPYKCEKCNYTSFHRTLLQNHMAVHMDERPFKCDYCTYTTTAQRYLTTHVRLHTDDKRYKCDICYFRFVEANLLRNHRKRHFSKSQKTHRCRFCPSELWSRDALREHVELLHRVEIFK